MGGGELGMPARWKRFWHRIRSWKNRVTGDQTSKEKVKEALLHVSLMNKAWRETAGGLHSPTSPLVGVMILFENIKEDWQVYEKDLARQGLWVMVVYRFGRWRYSVRILDYCGNLCPSSTEF